MTERDIVDEDPRCEEEDIRRGRSFFFSFLFVLLFQPDPSLFLSLSLSLPFSLSLSLSLFLKIPPPHSLPPSKETSTATTVIIQRKEKTPYRVLLASLASKDLLCDRGADEVRRDLRVPVGLNGNDRRVGHAQVPDVEYFPVAVHEASLLEVPRTAVCTQWWLGT